MDDGVGAASVVLPNGLQPPNPASRIAAASVPTRRATPPQATGATEADVRVMRASSTEGAARVRAMVVLDAWTRSGTVSIRADVSKPYDPGGAGAGRRR